MMELKSTVTDISFSQKVRCRLTDVLFIYSVSAYK